MSKSVEKIFHRKDSSTRLNNIEYGLRIRNVTHLRSRSVPPPTNLYFSKSKSSAADLHRSALGDTSSWLASIHEPVTVTNYHTKESKDYVNNNDNNSVIVTPEGAIILHLRYDIRLDISLEKAVRITNTNCDIIMVLNAKGDSAALIHPNGRVYQYGSKVEILVNDNHGNSKFAKMSYKGVSFTSSQSALIYLVDEAGTRTTIDSFIDLSQHDFTLNVFFDLFPKSESSSLSGEETKPESTTTTTTTASTELINRAIYTLRAASCWYAVDGTENCIINGVRISQTLDGLVRIGRDSDQFALRTSPTTGSASISTPFIHCTGSVGDSGHLFVRRGERRMHYDGKNFILRNAGNSAGLNENNQLKLY